MGIGKPVILTESLETSRLPEDACLRIPSGAAEAESLYRHVLLLAAQPLLGPSM